MKLIIESTDKIVELEFAEARGAALVPARVWEGRTASGIPVYCFVTRVAVHEDRDQAQFEAELRETRKPSAAVAAIPLRMVL